ncbi:tyrosine-type recombinase/integrase [Nocardioides pocheonensis]|nr:site-specific integrase [Nocardioides pocheonensis]
MGSIEERYGGRSFRATWRANGRRENRSFTTYEEARDFLNAMAINIRQGGVPIAVSKSRTRFEDFARHWLACETKDRSKKESILKNHLVPAFGRKPIGQITRREVQDWINRVQRDAAVECEVCDALQTELGDDDARCRRHKGRKPPSPRSIKDHYVMLSQVMRAAEREGYLLNGCPVGKGLHTFPDVDKRMVILNDYQADHLLEVAAEQFPAELAMVHLDSHTGLRLGELVALSREQYDGSSLLIDRAFKRSGIVGKTKTGRVRCVTLDDCCKRVLNEHLAGLDPEQRLIFPAVGGGMLIPTNWRKRVWYPLVEAAGLGHMGLHIHDLRHTHCSNLLAAGWEVTAVAERLGHASTKMTLDVYAHPLAGRQAALLAEKGLRPQAPGL